jgi:hypothetical protein
MPDEPKDEGTVETGSGQLGDAHRNSPVRAAAIAAAVAVPKELLDERQRRIGERRKPAGPPHPDAAVRGRALEEEEPSDVPPTECE